MTREASRISLLLLGLAVSMTCLLAGVSIARAHQPVMVETDAAVTVEAPEVSKAYYGTLPSRRVAYIIVSPKSFRLFVSILAPDVTGAKPNVSGHVFRYGKLIASLEATSAEWEKTYEPFGGDSYFQGPELRKVVPSGAYRIVLSRPDNRGKYTLAIGEKEEFPLDEVLRTLLVLPRLKAEFFGKPWWTAYFNLLGLFTFGPILVIVAVAVAVRVFLRRRHGARTRAPS